MPSRRSPPTHTLQTAPAGQGRSAASTRSGRLFFFFQAEDGIRDYKVTGVQTCALPIFTVEAGTETVPAVARVAEGAERERIWAEEIALVPKFAEFEAAAGRQIPVVVLRSEERRVGEEGRSRWAPDH